MTPRPFMADFDPSIHFGLLQTLFDDLHPFNLLQLQLHFYNFLIPFFYSCSSAFICEYDYPAAKS
ncbi:hypothetical protein CY34DRAFT_225351 [Suillus luteus UH-Slu-Lm8-n1]|uniref:Uncharacterized protein n=1 Tax=Suillus luteus UH-Slu-Lm8-n1 TaxID=930992 RepID=A0A0D0ASY9_9AGAM|nr:hypothetical protein CY34DRAFT_225351 [Suillus luteus UH-Slu-Lm8-n1]